jgi:hypothetical protein
MILLGGGQKIVSLQTVSHDPVTRKYMGMHPPRLANSGPSPLAFRHCIGAFGGTAEVH